jgi:hypothetical protein
MGSITLKAQTPDFKFHLAFEDATGAKDTVWLIWDSLATTGYDTLFDEYPHSLPTDTFQVYIKYNGVDSGKVRAIGYDYDSYDFYISAHNYVEPLNIYWDSSLIFNNNLPFEIRESYFDNEWFFLNNNWGGNHAFNILLDNHVELPNFNYGSQNHFPMYFYMGYYTFVNINEQTNMNNIKIYPNPVSDKLMVDSEELEGIYSFKIYDIEGKQVVEQQLNSTHNVVNVNHLPNGIYHYKIIAPNKELLTGKISITK